MNEKYIEVAKEIIQREIKELIRLKDSINYSLVDLAERIYKNSGKLVITGIGKSGIIGKKIAATLSSTGTTTIFINSTEAIHGDLGVINPEDIVLGISNSGEGGELLNLIPAIKNIGAKFYSITGNSKSSLAQSSEITITYHIEQEGCPLNLAPMSSTTVELVLGDALAGILMKMRNFKPNNFAMYHPGGSLGRKLLTKLENLMIKKENLAICEEDSRIKEIIFKMNEKRLGIICVLRATKLIGIITEGDIRRALSDENNFFKYKAKDIMTRNYKKIQQNLLATEALSLMEEGEYQISVMPVFKESEFVGVVRIHDLLKIK